MAWRHFWLCVTIGFSCVVVHAGPDTGSKPYPFQGRAVHSHIRLDIEGLHEAHMRRRESAQLRSRSSKHPRSEGNHQQVVQEPKPSPRPREIMMRRGRSQSGMLAQVGRTSLNLRALKMEDGSNSARNNSPRTVSDFPDGFFDEVPGLAVTHLSEYKLERVVALSGDKTFPVQNRLRVKSSQIKLPPFVEKVDQGWHLSVALVPGGDALLTVEFDEAENRLQFIFANSLTDTLRFYLDRYKRDMRQLVKTVQGEEGTFSSFKAMQGLLEHMKNRLYALRYMYEFSSRSRDFMSIFQGFLYEEARLRKAYAHEFVYLKGFSKRFTSSLSSGVTWNIQKSEIWLDGVQMANIQSPAILVVPESFDRKFYSENVIFPLYMLYGHKVGFMQWNGERLRLNMLSVPLYVDPVVAFDERGRAYAEGGSSSGGLGRGLCWDWAKGDGQSHFEEERSRLIQGAQDIQKAMEILLSDEPDAHKVQTFASLVSMFRKQWASSKQFSASMQLPKLEWQE